LETAGTGTISVAGIIKGITVQTTGQKSREVQDSDFDRIAVLANIMKAIGEKGQEGVLAKVKTMPHTDQLKFTKLLEAVRGSDVFNNLTHSERRVINSAYRAIAFQEKKIPVFSKIGDFVNEVLRDLHTSEIPVTERKKIEDVLTGVMPKAEDLPKDEHERILLFAKEKIKLSLLINYATYNEKEDSVFGIKQPSDPMKDFAKAVKEKAKKLLSDLEKETPKDPEEKGEPRAQEESTSKKPEPPTAEPERGPQEEPQQPRTEEEKKTPEEALAEFKDWFLHNMTGEQEDAIRALERNPEYQEFCKLARWAVVSVYQDFQDVFEACTSQKMALEEFSQRCADISNKLNQLVTPNPVKGVKEQGKTVLSLQKWLQDKKVTAADDPRIVFLNDLPNLFRSSVRKARGLMQDTFGAASAHASKHQAPQGAEDVPTTAEFDEEAVLTWNKEKKRFEMPSLEHYDRKLNQWYTVVSWYDPETGKKGTEKEILSSEDVEEGPEETPAHVAEGTPPVQAKPILTVAIPFKHKPKPRLTRK
jgi:hypothetical protein